MYKFRTFIEFEKYDFSTHDYLFTFGKELIEIKTVKDNCDHLSRTPIEAVYHEKELNNFIYLYQIKDKNKYRDICP